MGGRTERKREGEQQLVGEMIALYCRGRHGGRAALCPECKALGDYAAQRIGHCPHMAEKSFCSRCPTPCYRPEMRAEIRKVMAYAGPRMLLRHPVLLLRHAMGK